MTNQIKKEYDELVKVIEYHNDRYYNQDDPEITDQEYDKLTQKLRQMEKEYPELVTANSPSQKITGAVKRELGIPVEHKVPMLSLLDVFNKEDVISFVEDVKKAYPNEAEELFAEAERMAKLRYKSYIRKSKEVWSEEA